MEFKYRLTRKEVQHVRVHEVWRTPLIRRRLMLRQSLLTGIMFGLVSYILTLGFDTLTSVLAAAAVALFFYIMFRPLMNVQLRSMAGKSYDLFAVPDEFDVHIGENSVYIGLPKMRSEVDWTAFSGITEDEVGFYLTYGPLQSVFVPRRVFATAKQANDFYLLAQTYWQHARAAEPSAAAAPVRIR